MEECIENKIKNDLAKLEKTHEKIIKKTDIYLELLKILLNEETIKKDKVDDRIKTIKKNYETVFVEYSEFKKKFDCELVEKINKTISKKNKDLTEAITDDLCRDLKELKKEEEDNQKHLLNHCNLIIMFNLIDKKIKQKQNEEIFILKVADVDKENLKKENIHSKEIFIDALSKLNSIHTNKEIKNYFNFDFNHEFFKNTNEWCDNKVKEAQKYYEKLNQLDKSIPLLNDKYINIQQQILHCQQDLEIYLELKPGQNLVPKS